MSSVLYINPTSAGLLDRKHLPSHASSPPGSWKIVFFLSFFSLHSRESVGKRGGCSLVWPPPAVIPLFKTSLVVPKHTLSVLVLFLAQSPLVSISLVSNSSCHSLRQCRFSCSLLEQPDLPLTQPPEASVQASDSCWNVQLNGRSTKS